MSKNELNPVDLTLIETRARQLRAQYIAGFFKRRSQ